MYFRRKTSSGRAYLQIVESRRDGDQVRQQVIATLGRFDELQASGQLERLLRSGARFAAKAMVLSAANDDAAIKIAVRRIGPALVFERLWEETGCRVVMAELAGRRKHGFVLERAVFLTVLHRLFVSGSDRAADRWREDYAIAGVEGLDLHHLYRAMAWLGKELPEKEQDGRTPFAPRCLKDVVEERLFAHRRDLLTRLDLVFMDTTSLYFEGAGGQTLGQHGYSKDHRPDLRQMILAVLIDGDGRPVCSEMWPGNTADVTTLIPVIDRLRRRFHIARVCVVADRGMISAETIAEPAPFVPLEMKKRSKEIDYEAKTVMLAGRRYIVCRNQQEAQKDAADRASIVAALERQLAKGDKALVGNTGFRRYLKTISNEHFAIDPDKIEEERKFDGIFVLRTNTDLNPLEAMLCYKQLWTVEQTFRTAKHLFSTRPIFHKLDETIRGHVFCSFLALVLKTALEDRIAALGRSGSWPEIIADLDSLTETEIEHDGKRFIVRSAPRPAASLALRAAGIALPPTVREAAAS
jgi:hypothetical protein